MPVADLILQGPVGRTTLCYGEHALEHEQNCGVSQRETSGHSVEQEAGLDRLGWSLWMVAAAGLCWAEIGRADEMAVKRRATIRSLNRVTDDQREARAFAFFETTEPSATVETAGCRAVSITLHRIQEKRGYV